MNTWEYTLLIAVPAHAIDDPLRDQIGAIIAHETGRDARVERFLLENVALSANGKLPADYWLCGMPCMKSMLQPLHDLITAIPDARWSALSGQDAQVIDNGKTREAYDLGQCFDINWLGEMVSKQRQTVQTLVNRAAVEFGVVPIQPVAPTGDVNKK